MSIHDLLPPERDGGHEEENNSSSLPFAEYDSPDGIEIVPTPMMQRPDTSSVGDEIAYDYSLDEADDFLWDPSMIEGGTSTLPYEADFIAFTPLGDGEFILPGPSEDRVLGTDGRERTITTELFGSNFFQGIWSRVRSSDIRGERFMPTFETPEQFAERFAQELRFDIGLEARMLQFGNDLDRDPSTRSQPREHGEMHISLSLNDIRERAATGDIKAQYILKGMQYLARESALEYARAYIENENFRAGHREQPSDYIESEPPQALLFNTASRLIQDLAQGTSMNHVIVAETQLDQPIYRDGFELEDDEFIGPRAAKIRAINAIRLFIEEAVDKLSIRMVEVSDQDQPNGMPPQPLFEGLDDTRLGPGVRYRLVRSVIATPIVEGLFRSLGIPMEQALQERAGDFTPPDQMITARLLRDTAETDRPEWSPVARRHTIFDVMHSSQVFRTKALGYNLDYERHAEHYARMYDTYGAMSTEAIARELGGMSSRDAGIMKSRIRDAHVMAALDKIFPHLRVFRRMEFPNVLNPALYDSIYELARTIPDITGMDRQRLLAQFSRDLIMLQNNLLQVALPAGNGVQVEPFIRPDIRPLSRVTFEDFDQGVTIAHRGVTPQSVAEIADRIAIIENM